jgi:hypothetical protein
MLVMIRTNDYARRRRYRSVLRKPEFKLGLLLFVAGILWVWFS